MKDITLSKADRDDAETKYTGVGKKLHSHYYGGTYDDSKKFLFGSHKTHTNILPICDGHDVDLIFKIPREIFDKYDAYESSGQAALLQDVRNALKEKYTTTDKIKAWTKVVLVEFSEGHHNVEVLPALELEDGTFKIPNSCDGGDWEIFDPRAELKKFEDSNKASDGLTRDLAKMIKSWIRKTSSLDYTSYKMLNDVIEFVNTNYSDGIGNDTYADVVCAFFDYLETSCDDDDPRLSAIKTAHSRAIKAMEYADDNKPKEASEKWRQIFGDKFPLVEKNPEREIKAAPIVNPARPWLG